MLYILHWCQNQPPGNNPCVCQAQMKDSGSRNWEEKTPQRQQPQILLVCFLFSMQRTETKSSELRCAAGTVQLLKLLPEEALPGFQSSKLQGFRAGALLGLAEPWARGSQIWVRPGSASPAEPWGSFRHLKSGVINIWSLSGSCSEKCVRELATNTTR